MGPLGDEDTALGVQDVAGQFGAAPGRVDPGDGGTGEGRRTQPERVFGGVVEQHPDVRCGAGRQQVGEERRPRRRARRHPVMAQHPPLEPQPRPVVAPPFLYEFRDGAPHGPHGGAR
jgi:hypothetical protein